MRRTGPAQLGGLRMPGSQHPQTGSMERARTEDGPRHPLEEMAERTLARDATRPAIEFEGRWISWGEMRAVAEQMNALIAASGTPQRAPVALLCRNRPSAVAALLGLLSKGHTIQMIYAFQSAAAKARNIERLKPAVVIAAAEEFSEEVRTVMHAHGIAGVAIEDMHASVVQGLELALPTHEIEVPAASQIEILTSGTTGPPKQFAVSYDLIAKHHVGVQFLANGSAADPLQLTPLLLFFPLGNISGIYSTLPTMLRGQRAILLDRFSIAAWHEHVLRYRPTASGMPPAGVQMVLDANIPREDLASIRTLGTGAAPLDPTVQRAFEERYGIPILLSYGATEFGGPVAAMTAELHAQWGKQKFGSVGRALPGAQLRVIDPDTGAVLPPNHEGILEVISPRIGSHWIRTSDIGVVDADGFLFHRGRADGAIMRGGFKVLPETIERALMLHPSISAAAVVGIDDKRLGQVPAAAIQLKPGAQPPSNAELEAHLREHVAATHIPTQWLLVPDLPKNASMKFDRPAVRRLFQSDIAAEAHGTRA